MDKSIFYFTSCRLDISERANFMDYIRNTASEKEPTKMNNKTPWKEDILHSLLLTILVILANLLSKLLNDILDVIFK